MILEIYSQKILSGMFIIISLNGPGIAHGRPIHQSLQGGRGSEDDRINGLIAKLQNRDLREKDPARFEQAISELGSLKNEHGAPILVQLLTYEAYEYRRTDVWFRSPNGERYPAMYALAEIGETAVPALVNVLENTDNASLSSSNARQTLILIFRADLGKGIELLEAAAEKSRSAAGASRLRLAESDLRKFQKDLLQQRKH